MQKTVKFFEQQVFCAQIYLALICLAHSSAAVETSVTSINLIKTNIRNHFGAETMEGLLFTKQILSHATN